MFDRFDEDKKSYISCDDFEKAVAAFGYRVATVFVKTLYETYKPEDKIGLSFDLFVQCCVGLKRMTDVFKKYDEDRDGYITISFEEMCTGKLIVLEFNPQ